MRNLVDFGTMVGQTITSIDGAVVGSDHIVIRTDRGTFVLEHTQDCCESVSVEDVTGDPADLIGAAVTTAEESCPDDPAPQSEYGPPESFTWTFYRICTPKGDLTIRWLGESNGYYSESVDVVFLPGVGPDGLPA